MDAQDCFDQDHTLTTLLIKGEYDAELNALLESNLEILHQNSYSPLVEIRGARHFPNMEKPERFNRELLNLLTEPEQAQFSYQPC